MNEKLLTPEQVAERLRVTERTVYGWLRRGTLPALKLGRHRDRGIPGWAR